MRSIIIRVAPFVAAVAVTALSTSAHAQQVYVQPAPTASVGTGAPPGAVVQPQQGEYVAPLQQTTQPSYIPQSVAFSGPRIIKDYNEGDPVPPGYHPESRVSRGLIGGGLGMFGGAYLISVFVAAVGSDLSNACTSFGGGGCTNPLWPLYLPVVGPWVTMGTAGGSATGMVFLAIDGLLQGAGAAMTIIGIVAPKTVLVRNDLGSLHIQPTMVGGMNPGIGLGGTF
ncbi:hypothetical protein BH09MYX1_BH09MYX1_38170 [soil metagenome]